MKQELISLSKFEEDAKWLNENIDQFRDKYENKFVAIKDKKIVVSGNKLKKVIKSLEEKNLNPACIVIEFIHEKGYTLVA